MIRQPTRVSQAVMASFCVTATTASASTVLVTSGADAGSFLAAVEAANAGRGIRSRT